MQNDLINGLLEALKFSPDNLPLRLTLAEALFSDKQYSEAETQFRFITDRDPNNFPAKLGLAKTYLELGKNSTAIVILEELIEIRPNDVSLLVNLSKALLRNNEAAKAIEHYKSVLSLNPSFTDNELDQLRNTSSAAGKADDLIQAIEDELNDVEKPKINFDDVGGMTKAKEEIKIKIIQPLLHPELYKAYGKKTGGGILLYGPPGCGKTYLARATAGQIQASFISIGIHDVLDMWMGNSEKRLHDIFELARRQTPCVLFFDEIDALGASRSDMRSSSAKMLINQFLTEMDGIQSSNEGVLILGATNAPWHLDAAFRRPGRFDRIIFIQPPDASAREWILNILLRDKPVKNVDTKTIAKKAEDFSGADLKGLVDFVIEEKLRESFERGSLTPIENNDLLKGLKDIKPSTREWFTTARNYALYSNESGIYDEILNYLKIKK